MMFQRSAVTVGELLWFKASLSFAYKAKSYQNEASRLYSLMDDAGRSMLNQRGH